jgi:hypothetical protein
VSRFRWSAAPPGVTLEQKQNFINVQIDAVGVGLAGAAATFLPIFLTRLGATNLQVGLLSSMPAVTGLFLAILVGRFLQTQRNIIPWFSIARLMVISAYALTGILPWIVPDKYLVNGVLLIWAIVTLPQTILIVSFSVVMNAVAGPKHRYDLLSRRWSILGVVIAVSVALAGQALVRIIFPLNYQLVFIVFSLGGLISFYFSRRIKLPDSEAVPISEGKTLRQQTRGYFKLVQGQPDFIRFSVQRFVYLFGIMLAIPLFPLYYVRVVEANDAWIGTINTASSAVLLVGYFLWTRGSQLRGSRFVLLWTTFGLAVYPALTAATTQVQLIVIFAGLAGIFQAGLDLVFFDELMKTVPVQYSATFVSLSQSLQHLSTIFAPLLGTFLAGYIGLSGALLVAAGVRFIGFGLFALWQARPSSQVNLDTASAPVTQEES